MSLPPDNLTSLSTLSRHLCSATVLLVLFAIVAASPAGIPTDPAITVLADFEDASVATSIGAVQNVSAADCRVRRESIPARGQGSLALTIGATAPRVSVVCDLIFRTPVRLERADQVATFVWLNEGAFELAFRLRDARGQVFETQANRVDHALRWVRYSAPVDADALTRIRGEQPLTPPFEVAGYRVTTTKRGEQTIYLDDLQIEHRVLHRDLIRGEFELNEPTQIYAPGATVGAAVVLENQSRTRTLTIFVDLAWRRPDGSVLATEQASVRLPPGGNDFRAYRRLDFSQRIDTPGLYQLVAEARAANWPAPNVFETTIAVTPSNRRLSRGRSTFFGVRSNLLAEPELDQLLEIGVARDMGVNLLALDTPWRLIEPKPDAINFALLDPLVAALTARDIAPLLIITAPPRWLPADHESRQAHVATLIDALFTHYEGRLARFQLTSSIFIGLSVPQQLDATLELHQQLVSKHDQLELLTPPAVPLDDLDLAPTVGQFIATNPDFPVAFATAGSPEQSRQMLEGFRIAGGFHWRPAHRWFHTADPLVGAGRDTNAEEILRHYVTAAAAGVGGLVWYDLRDDDVSADHADRLRGLVRRDFSPKTRLLGYAAAAGQLTGYACHGPVAGTPAGFTSALFIGGNRQIAVLLPNPNADLPAVLAPIKKLPGQLTAQDFERRAYPVLESTAPPLVAAIPRPLFITLELKQPQPDPQLALANPPWLRLPHTVFCNGSAEFNIAADLVVPLTQSYLQLIIPRDAPLESSFSALALTGEVGETLTQSVRLTPRPGANFEHLTLALRASIAGDTLEIPIHVRAVTTVRQLPRGTMLSDPRFTLAELATSSDVRATATVTLLAAFQAQALHLNLKIEDDRIVPPMRTDGSTSGDRVLISIARAGDPLVQQFVLYPGSADATISPTANSTLRTPDYWRARIDGSPESGTCSVKIEIPARALSPGVLRPGDRFRLAVRYLDDDDDGFPAQPVDWGGGVDGNATTQTGHWITLGS